MNLRFEPVETDEQINETADLAAVIWNEYWPSIIGQEQTDYMVSTMQSAEAMTNDIREHGYLYFRLYDEADTCVGYAAAAEEDVTGHEDDPGFGGHGEAINKLFKRRLFVSKIYLLSDQRGKHYCSRVIEFFEGLCTADDLQGMYLTVNRENELAVRAYLGRGFKIIEEVDSPIGNGFEMNDYIMALALL